MTPGQMNQARIKALEETALADATKLAKEWLETRDLVTLKLLANVVMTAGTINGRFYRQFKPSTATEIEEAISRYTK